MSSTAIVSLQLKGLISGSLEQINKKVFYSYHDEITSLIGKHQGVYALYQKGRLYYVGLAKDLRNRVKYHLKDKHANKWDTFSLFLVHRPEHLKELEALLIHIAKPKGNIQKGKFAIANNLKPELETLIKTKSKAQIENILGTAKKKKTEKVKRLSGPHKAPKDLVLHKLLSPGAQIKATYKGKEILATIDEIGKILLNGKLYNSPSAAGVSVIDRSTVNGWRFWKYKNAAGKWVTLGELLKNNTLTKIGDEV
jgi:hypothetical protein